LHRLYIRFFRMKQEATLTSLTVVVGLFGVYLYANSLLLAQIIFGLGLVLVLFSSARDVLHSFWMFLTKILGYVMPNILLSLVFFLVVTPLGLFTRLIKVKSLLTLKNDQSSFFVKTTGEFSKKSFEQPW